MGTTVDCKTDVKINKLYECYECKTIVIDCFETDYYGVSRDICFDCIGICRNCGQWACRCQ